MRVHGVEADAGVAADDAQGAVVVQQVEVVRRRARRSAPVVGDAAAREVRVDVARVNGAALAHEGEELLRLAGPAAGEAPDDAARVHQRLDPRRDEAVVDEDVLGDVERRIPPLEIAGAVARDAVPQDQVLGSRRGADGIRLHEAEPIDRARQRRRPEQAAGDGEAAQVVECHRSHRRFCQLLGACSEHCSEHAPSTGLHSTQKPRT